MPNFYTPEFLPPIPAPQGDLQQWAHELGAHLNAWLHNRVDELFEAYIQSTAQFADSLIDTNLRKAASTQAVLTTGSATNTGATPVSFNVTSTVITHGLSKIPLITSVTGGNQKKPISIATLGTTNFTVSWINLSPNTADMTVTVYFW